MPVRWHCRHLFWPTLRPARGLACSPSSDGGPFAGQHQHRPAGSADRPRDVHHPLEEAVCRAPPSARGILAAAL